MGSTSPCASCKLLRRRCDEDCVFAPYFPSDDPQKFAIVHKVFGASHVSKLLRGVPVHERGDAVSSIVYEANARVRNPVYGCVAPITLLQNQVSELQMQLVVAQAKISSIQMQNLEVYPNHEADKGKKGKKSFETAQENKHEAAESSDAAVNRVMKFTFDLNDLPSCEDKDITLGF